MSEMDQHMLTRTWARSPEREVYLRRRKRIVGWLVAAVVVLFVAVGITLPPATAGEQWLGGFVGLAALVGIGYCSMPYWAARTAFKERLRTSKQFQAELALQALAGVDGDESAQIPMNKLFAYNRAQLDAYQEESRNQQRVAFRAVQASAASGLLVLLAAGVFSLSHGPGTETYVVAGLGGLGAALSGYVASTFAQGARRADRRQSVYYQEPHMMGRVIVAERLARQLPTEQRPELVKAILAQMLAWPLAEDRVDEPAVPPEPTPE